MSFLLAWLRPLLSQEVVRLQKTFGNMLKCNHAAFGRRRWAAEEITWIVIFRWPPLQGQPGPIRHSSQPLHRCVAEIPAAQHRGLKTGAFLHRAARIRQGSNQRSLVRALWDTP